MRFRFHLSLIVALLVCTYSWAQISEKTSQEIRLLLNEKNARTPAQRKIDSRLLQFMREKRGQKMVAGVNLERVALDADSKGNIQVDIEADVNDNLLTRIESMGGKIISSSMRFHALRAEIDATQAEGIAALAEVKFIAPAAPMALQGPLEHLPGKSPANNKTVKWEKRAGFEARARRVQDFLKNYLAGIGVQSPMFAGSINSQGDKAHRAEDARNTYGYAGQGIRIAVLSNSYNFLGGAPADVLSGDLPGVGNPFGNTTPVTVIQDGGSTDEGRAMLQIVHDLAPKASLYFATGNGGSANFATNILALRNAPNNCDIIIDDLTYSDEPVFYDGIVAQAVNTVTANGALYFSSAGNWGSLAKSTSGVYEGDFNDVGSPAFGGGTKIGTVHNFGTSAVPAGGDSIIASGGWYLLHWADPAGASANDYDLFVVSSTGTIKASSTNIQNGTQNPIETITTIPTLVAGDRLVVFKTTAAAVRAFHLNSAGGRLKFATQGQTFGHSAIPAAFSVAATPAAAAAASPTGLPTQNGPFPGAFSSSNQVEYFSSDGPRRIFFNSNGTAITPGNFLFATSGGVVRNKPDITAADGVTTTLPNSLRNFYGTSAAAPHAGAIAGLLKSANPALTPAQMRTLLTTTAVDIETPGYDNVSGFGILQAFQAMQVLSPTPQAALVLGAVASSEGSFNNGNGSVDPGELANLSVQLSNNSMVNATNVSATITATTPGVTIVQGGSAYPAINAGGSGINVTPFVIAINSSVPCGTVLNFLITVSFTGGPSPQVFAFSILAGSQPFAGGINAVLGGTPPTGAGYTVVSGQQTGRLTRGNTASTCAAPVANPGLNATTGARQYDAYTFTNTSAVSQCVTVTLTSPNIANIYSVAYTESGFVPATPNLNYLAEPALGAVPLTYSFTVAPSKPFTIVVHDVNVLPASNSPYSLSLSLASCSPGPACTPTDITNATIANGATGAPYNQDFAATGGSSNYIFTLIGTLPTGMSFSGNKLSGTPLQAGTFPIKIVATDVTGCPPDTNSYSLFIAGNPPASLTAILGTPQTIFPSTNFRDSLRVIVRDASNNPLGGVSVFFTAPATGASGTFVGGVKTVTVVTNASGIATAPAFTANATMGSYTVTASVVGLPDAVFNLSNFCPSSLVVTSNADSGPGTLREIVNNTCAGISVTFDPSITSIVLTSGEIVITKGITITGPGASKLTISGNNNSRVFNIVADTATVNISGITIRDGKPVGGTFGGGGILINNGSAVGAVNIVACLITNNDVTAAGSAFGGGIDNEGGRVTISYSSITNNTSTFRGGGIQSQNFGAMTIYNSTISGNTAGTGGIGGGIRSFLPLSLTNCTIFGNSAQTGGNISRSGDTVLLNNTIVAGGTLIGTGGTGPDISGGGFKSADYNLIQNLAGSGTLVGVTTHNITGLNPLLLPLGSFGGETPTRLPQPSSPVINAGDPALSSGFDQRGLPRNVGGQSDIGAAEVSYTLATTAGSSQQTAVLKPFATPMQARVLEYTNQIAGISVFFSAPTTGASGTFPNGLTRDTVFTNSSGLATSRIFTANNVVGAYSDTVRIGAPYPFMTYQLENLAAVPIIYGNVTATASNCETNISWQTLTEINAKDFSVESSSDGINFTTMVSMPARGNSTTLQSYTYSHISTSDGVYYYRIKETDLDGKYTYSNVLIVTNSCGKQPIVAYPNPIQNQLTVVLPGSEKRTLAVYDAAGHKVFQQTVTGGTHKINAAGWITGVYTLSISSKNEKAYLLKVIKD